MIGELPPLKETVNTIFARLSNPVCERRVALVEAWPQIAGPNISRHTKVYFGLNKQVNVWVDDSTLAFELRRRFRQSLLKRLQNQFGEAEVSDVRFFVGQLRS